MIFRTAYNHSCGRSFASPSGRGIKEIYVRSISSNGVTELVKSSDYNLYEFIQKASIGIKLEDLIKRVKAGDADAISPPVDSFIDVSNMPTDLLGMHALVTSVKNKFDALPISVRSKFDNSFGVFLKSVSTGTFLDNSNKESPLSDEEIKKIRETLGGNNNGN